MRILLTGSTGFIGSAFCRYVLDRGHEVAALVHQSRSPFDTISRLICLRGSLAEAPWNDIRQFQPDLCVHCAWISTPGVYLESAQNRQFLKWSRDFLHRTLELGAKRILALGTCVEYKASTVPLSEDTGPLSMLTEYARCKHMLHEELHELCLIKGATLCWTRVFYPYGPGEHPARLCSSIIQRLSRDQPIMIRTPESTKDYIYIDDLVRALYLLLTRGYAGTINLGTGVGKPIREIANIIGTIMRKPHLIHFNPDPQLGPPDCHIADVNRLQRLDWHAEVSIESGLLSLVNQLGR